jgi:hypothetical protein
MLMYMIQGSPTLAPVIRWTGDDKLAIIDDLVKTYLSKASGVVELRDIVNSFLRLGCSRNVPICTNLPV